MNRLRLSFWLIHLRVCRSNVRQTYFNVPTTRQRVSHIDVSGYVPDFGVDLASLNRPARFVFGPARILSQAVANTHEKVDYVDFQRRFIIKFIIKGSCYLIRPKGTFAKYVLYYIA